MREAESVSVEQSEETNKLANSIRAMEVSEISLKISSELLCRGAQTLQAPLPEASPLVGERFPDEPEAP